MNEFEKEVLTKLARIDERLKNTHEETVSLKNAFKEMNGSLRITCEDVAVLKQDVKDQKALNGKLTTGIIGAIVTIIVSIFMR